MRNNGSKRTQFDFLGSTLTLTLRKIHDVHNMDKSYRVPHFGHSNCPIYLVTNKTSTTFEYRKVTIFMEGAYTIFTTSTGCSRYQQDVKDLQGFIHELHGYNTNHMSWYTINRFWGKSWKFINIHHISQVSFLVHHKTQCSQISRLHNKPKNLRHILHWDHALTKKGVSETLNKVLF